MSKLDFDWSNFEYKAIQIFPPTAKTCAFERVCGREDRTDRKIMKSSKGKMPVGGKTKRVTVVAHAARKPREKDPVEVRDLSFSLSQRLPRLPPPCPGVLQGAAAES